jgi:hypothetical protein
VAGTLTDVTEKTTMPKDSNSKPKRDEFWAAKVDILSIIPGNFDHAKGKPIAIMTVARGKEIEQPMGISLADARAAITSLLLVLATHEDQVARHLLDDHFDSEGDQWLWPTDYSPS